MARLLADENFPFGAVLRLRDLGHDVVTLQETGQGGAGLADAALLAQATADARAVVTLNRRDFIRLHNLSPNHAGIIVCRVDPDPTALADRVNALIASEPDLTGKLIRVNRA